MATLIKHNRQPDKHVLIKKLRLLPINKWIPKSRLDHKSTSLLGLSQEIDKARQKLFHFQKNCGVYELVGFNRGLRDHQARLMIETMRLVAKWQKNVEHEAMAIDILAAKIAKNITGQKIHTMNMARERLSKTFLLKILIDEKSAKRLAGCYADIAQALGQEQLFYPSMGPFELRIETITSCFAMDFHKKDLDRILKEVQKGLKHS